MANLTLRTLTRPGDTTKNAPLTNAEVDANFINLDADIELRAPIDSPEFTGTPTAPTPTTGDNSLKLATTEFVTNALVPVNAEIEGINLSIGTINTDLGALTASITTTGDTISFNSTGAIAIPSGTESERPATPVDGDLRYNTTTNTFEGYSKGVWGAIGGGATGGAGNATFWENDQTITVDYTITAGKNAGTFGPVTVADGVTVTVPENSTWTIV